MRLKHVKTRDYRELALISVKQSPNDARDEEDCQARTAHWARARSPRRQRPGPRGRSVPRRLRPDSSAS